MGRGVRRGTRRVVPEGIGWRSACGGAPVREGDEAARAIDASLPLQARAPWQACGSTRINGLLDRQVADQQLAVDLGNRLGTGQDHGHAHFLFDQFEQVADAGATRGGQGMFMISVSSVWRELEGTLSTLPGERTAEEAAEAHPGDELAARRRARAV